jgi:hypothetical protein
MDGISQPSWFPKVDGSLLSRANLIEFIREFHRAHEIGNFFTMEFGVLNGEGSVDILRGLRSGEHKNHFGFDSFDGFPQNLSATDNDNLKLQASFHGGGYKGLNLNEVSKLVGLSVRTNTKIEFISGFFDKSLKDFDLTQLKDSFPLLMYVDCDLYTSSKLVFNFIDKIAMTGT